MPDSKLTRGERKPQRAFSIATHLGAIGLALGVFAMPEQLWKLPDRHAAGPPEIALAFQPVEHDAAFAGAWKLTSGDPRFGGISALAVDRGQFLALSDSGFVFRFALNGGTARIQSLPAGPGKPIFKRDRDSEALLRDPAGRGWWVAFENHNELWLYDPDFSRPLARIPLRGRWPENTGMEGAATWKGRVLLFSEDGSPGIRIDGAGQERFATGGVRPISDAATEGESILALERRITLLGFSTSLVRLAPTANGFRAGRRYRLPLGPLDNVEALAIERRGARTRLWLMTDDNQQAPLRTLLIAFDLPPEMGGKR